MGGRVQMGQGPGGGPRWGGWESRGALESVPRSEERPVLRLESQRSCRGWVVGTEGAGAQEEGGAGRVGTVGTTTSEPRRGIQVAQPTRLGLRRPQGVWEVPRFLRSPSPAWEDVVRSGTCLGDVSLLGLDITFCSFDLDCAPVVALKHYVLPSQGHSQHPQIIYALVGLRVVPACEHSKKRSKITDEAEAPAPSP